MKLLLSLSLKSWRNRRGSVLLSILAILVSVALITGVQYVRDQARQSFLQTVSGTDLIVGARSGPINLLLYSVFRIGNPTNNIGWQSYRWVADHPAVAWAVPISLGDSHRGFRVLGTTPAYFEHFRYGERTPLRFSAGAPFGAEGDGRFGAVLGATVARELGYEMNAPIVVAHGLADTRFARHQAHPFRVVGILAPTGTPVDRTVHVSLGGLEAIHRGMHHGLAPAGGDPAAVTALLVGLESRVATFRLQREINNYRAEPLLAILPGVALAELWEIVGPVERLLQLIAGCVVAAGLIGLLITLLATLNERRREMAVLRAVGAGPRHLLFLFVFEAFWISLLAALGGMALLYGAVALAQPLIQAATGLHLPLQSPTPAQWRLLAAVVAIGTLLGLVPGWLALRRALADGLTMRL